MTKRLATFLGVLFLASPVLAAWTDGGTDVSLDAGETAVVPCNNATQSCMVTMVDETASTAIAAPGSGYTNLFTAGGEVWKRDPGDAAAYRLLTNQFTSIDWDPNASGTTTAGLREALYQCPTTGGCVIQARKGTTYDMSTYTFAAFPANTIANVCDCADDDNCDNDSTTAGDCSDIWIQGAPGATVTLGTAGSPWYPGATPGAVTFKQIIRFQDVTRGGVRDLNMSVYDACNSTTDIRCPSPSSEALMIAVGDNADDIEISGNTLSAYETNTGSEVGHTTDFDQWFGIESGGSNSGTGSGYSPRRLKVVRNTVAASAGGFISGHTGGGTLYDNEPDAPLLEGNTFLASNMTASPGPSKSFLVSMNANGARVIGNTFNMKEAVSNGSRQFTGFECVPASPGSDSMNNVGAGLTVTGNTFTHVGESNFAAKLVSCNGVVFSGNSFMAGECSLASSTSCIVDGECGGGTCDPTNAVGIFVHTGNIAATIGNVITGNVFSGGPKGDGGWIDTTYYAPIALEGVAATDPNGGRGNIIADNAFMLSDTADDGYSSFDSGGTTPTTWLARNTVYGNTVLGANTGSVVFDSGITMRTAPSNDDALTQVLVRDGTTGALKYRTATSLGSAFDSTTVHDTTWSDGVNAANIWTFDVSATDTTMTASSGLITFSHGVTVSGTTRTPTLTLTGTGTINGLDAIDSTTETTLEAALDIAGDVSGTGLNSVAIGSDKILESMLKSVNAATDEYCLTYESTVGDFEWQACGTGGGAFSDASDPIVMNTTTKDVVIGAAQKNAAKTTIDGDADQVQLSIQGHSTQTTNIITVENSAGDDLMTLSNTGVLTLASGGSVVIPGNTTGPQCVALAEDLDTGTNTISVCAGAGDLADATLTLPTATQTLLGTEGGTLTGDLVLSAGAGEGLSGGGLTDCDNSTTSKVLWDSATHKFSCGTDQDSVGATAWSAIGDATGVAVVDFGGFDQDITSAEDGGDILTIVDTDADQVADSTILRLATNDTSDANTFFVKGTTDDDGTPANDWVVANTGTAGGLTETLGSAGVSLTTDGDGAITFLGLGNGSDEDLTFNFDDTANTVSVTSSTGVTAVDYGTGIALKSGTLELGHASDTTLARGSAGVLTVEGNTVVTTVTQVYEYCWAISDYNTTAITAATGLATEYIRGSTFTLTGVRAYTRTAPTGTMTIDINEAGTTVLSTKLTIDANEKTSGTAATAAVISDSSIAANAEITVDVDSTTGGKGGVVCIEGHY